MSVREYIGARYVPLFADPIEWDNTKTYEPLTIVYYQGNSYTSRQAVPTGIAITNTTYWALTGNYNAQIEAYRAEVQEFADNIGELNAALPTTVFDETHTVDARFDDIEANNWVTTARINDNAVTNDKLDDDAVGTANIIDGNVTSDKLAANSVGTSKIIDNAITDNKIDNKLLKTIISGTLSPLDNAWYCDANIGDVGYAQSMAYDSLNDTLYIGSYNNNDTSTIRKYNNFISGNNAGTTITADDSFTFPNNHCNCMSFYNGKLYCWSWGAGYVDEVTFSSKTYTRINLGTYVRGGAYNNGIAILQPYNANFIEVSLPMNNVSPFLGMFNCVDVPSQVSYVQDSKIYDNCYCRLLSSGTYTNSYIEIIPYFSTSSQPIVVPIPYASEFEGMEIISDNLFIINAGGKIYKFDNFASVIPQVETRNLWSSEIRLLMSNQMKGTGLPTSVPDSSTLSSDFTYARLISIPEDIYQWTSVENLINAHLEIHFQSSSGTYETQAVSLRLLGETNLSTVGPSGGTYTPAAAVRSLADGIEILKLIIAWDRSTVYSGENNRHIFVAPTQRITIKQSGVTVSTDCSVITGIRAYLL